MAKQIKVPVPGEGLVTPEGVLTDVVLREPSYDTVFALGDPRTLCASPDGTTFVHVNNEILAAYVQKCLVQPKSVLHLEQGGGPLALRVRAAVLGFFQNGGLGNEPSKTSGTTSSTASTPDASVPTTSGA